MKSKIVPPYSWVGHIPFVFYLVDQLKPQVIVELGTHSGNSFCAFCEAAQKYSPSTKVFAVDLWQGDAHAGFYDEQVFIDLKQHVAKNYPETGTLIRKDFNDAVHDFEDKSIDCLHIDGLHTYEAVKNDFETWLPKLKPDAIVLLHDTEVYRDDFAVHAYWKELKSTHFVNFNFKQSNGLGVLATASDSELNSVKFIEHLNRNVFLTDMISGYGMTLLDKELESQKREKVEKKYSRLLNSKPILIRNKIKRIVSFFVK